MSNRRNFEGGYFGRGDVRQDGNGGYVEDAPNADKMRSKNQAEEEERQKREEQRKAELLEERQKQAGDNTLIVGADSPTDVVPPAMLQ